jgi:multidrug efflux system membrane fusion protein
LQAINRIDNRPQVSGVLSGVHFRDGSLVKKGDLLFTIDQRPFSAAVDSAEARLASSMAQSAFASSEFARAKALITDNAISRKEFEQKQNDANMASAAVLAAKAALRIAKLNLAYTQIRAPIDGRASRAEVTLGNLVTANEPYPLATLVSSAQIYASFDVSESVFLHYVDMGKAKSASDLPVFMGLADETGYPRKGTLSSVDNHLNPSSGTIRVRAVFVNSDGRLIPGLYARFRLVGDQPHPAVLIEESAVGTDQDKQFVYVVGNDNSVDYRQVHLGSVQGDLTIVTQGLKAGERIVVNGLQRIHSGAVITPHQVLMDPASHGSSS